MFVGLVNCAMIGILFDPEGCNLNKVGFEFDEGVKMYRCGKGHFFKYEDITEEYTPGESGFVPLHDSEEIQDDLYLAEIINEGADGQE